jgi:hypothetical protein
MIFTAIQCKIQLLSNGIAIDSSVINNYESFFIEKRRAYGIPDPEDYLSMRIPQELLIIPENIICSININPLSLWVLKYDPNNKNYYIQYDIFMKTVTFPIRPKFYDRTLISNTDKRVNQIISLYGGHSIGAFLSRNCCYEKEGVCRFCSLCNNHGELNDFCDVIDSDDLLESLEIALEENYPITQIMLNGGNKKDLNENFKFYVERALDVRKYLDNSNKKDIELHLIVSPPSQLDLIKSLVDKNIRIAMNMETYNDKIFAKNCPGKNKYIGHKNIFNALIQAVKFLGIGNVFSIFVGGLEPIDSINTGIDILTSEGIIPVINVLHVDPNTKISVNQRPSVEYIMSVGKHLQEAYKPIHSMFIPFYKDCGRNSIDTEAYDGLF